MNIPATLIIILSSKFPTEIQCTQVCGGGERDRVVECLEVTTGTRVGRELCEEHKQPPHRQHCNQVMIFRQNLLHLNRIHTVISFLVNTKSSTYIIVLQLH